MCALWDFKEENWRNQSKHSITMSHELFIQSGNISADESIMGDVMLNLGKTNDNEYS